jgi:type IV pilus assembly protein PilC
MFKSSKIDLPLPTQLLLVINDAIQNYGIFIIVVMILALIVFFYYRKTQSGAYTIDRLKLAVPLIGR